MPVVILTRRPGAQFKRTAAIQGDFVFHGPRRFFLKNRADKQKAWAFGMLPILFVRPNPLPQDNNVLCSL